MAVSTCNKCIVIILVILGAGLLIIPYPALKQLLDNRDLDTYNCTDARNFTYGGKSRGAYRATAFANMTVPVSPASNSTDNKLNVVVVKLRYPGITTWLPYAFNTRDDTTTWFSEISKSVSRRESLQITDNTNETIKYSDWFQCVSDTDLDGGYTPPALPNLQLYYASCAGGIVLFCLSAFICCMNSMLEHRARYDYIHLN